MRQETDTIDIIDDLRYVINENASIPNQSEQKYQSLNERLIDREHKLNLIDRILAELNLEC